MASTTSLPHFCCFQAQKLRLMGSGTSKRYELKACKQDLIPLLQWCRVDIISNSNCNRHWHRQAKTIIQSDHAFTCECHFYKNMRALCLQTMRPCPFPGGDSAQANTLAIARAYANGDTSVVQVSPFMFMLLQKNPSLHSDSYAKRHLSPTSLRELSYS